MPHLRLNRLSAVEWFWTRFLPRSSFPRSSRVSIAFRLWSGFGLQPQRPRPLDGRPQSQSPFGCGVVLDCPAPTGSPHASAASQSPFGCGVVLDLRAVVERVPHPQGLNRLSAVEWFWTGHHLGRTGRLGIRVSIAFRLWSGFGLSWSSAKRAPMLGWSQSPFGCGVVLDQLPRPRPCFPRRHVSLNRLSAVEWFWTVGVGDNAHCHERLNRLSAVEWFWTYSMP